MQTGRRVPLIDSGSAIHTGLPECGGRAAAPCPTAARWVSRLGLLAGAEGVGIVFAVRACRRRGSTRRVIVSAHGLP